MSHRSDVVWDATWAPRSRTRDALNLAAAVRFHYARLARVALTGKDPLK